MLKCFFFGFGHVNLLIGIFSYIYVSDGKMLLLWNFGVLFTLFFIIPFFHVSTILKAFYHFSALLSCPSSQYSLIWSIGSCLVFTPLYHTCLFNAFQLICYSYILLCFSTRLLVHSPLLKFWFAYLPDKYLLYIKLTRTKPRYKFLGYAHFFEIRNLTALSRNYRKFHHSQMMKEKISQRAGYADPG